ncbi:MAG: hypothetical protein VB875_12895 [Pirellulales bacterium]
MILKHNAQTSDFCIYHADEELANSRRERFMTIGIVWLVSIVYVCAVTVADPDLWGHTLYGIRSIEQGILTETTDPFSYTAENSTWVNHEWLSEYIYGWLWQNTGDTGLWMWRNLIVLGLFSIAGVVIFRSKASTTAAVVLLVLSGQCLANFCTFVRPQLATFLLFAATLALLRRYWDRPHPYIWFLPAISALWVNLHGGFLAGLGIQALFVFACGCRVANGWNWVQKRPQCENTHNRNIRSTVMLALVGLVSIGGTLINPYGLDMYSMLFEHLVPKQAVREWQPLWAAWQPPVYYIPFVLLAMTLIWSRRLRWIDVWIIGCISLQAVSHIRHIALLSIAMLVLFPTPLTDAVSRMFPQLIQKFSKPDLRWLRIGAVAALLVVTAALRLPVALQVWQHDIRPWQIAVETKNRQLGMPVRATSEIDRLGISGNLITDYAWGQYILWHLHPETHVAFDGRYRTIYPAKLEHEFLTFLALERSGPRHNALLDDYKSEIALLPRHMPACDYLASRTDWRQIYGDDQAVLFVRDLPKFQPVFEQTQRKSIDSPAIATWLRFPAGPRLTPSVRKMKSSGQRAAHNMRTSRSF